MCKDFFIIAGPCSVESETQMEEVFNSLSKVKEVVAIRGGAFKPRTNPESFQGLKDKGIDILVDKKQKYNMPIVTELMDVRDIDLFKDVDVIQIGARNMQNYPLLVAAAKLNKPILLKRGFGNTIDELLASADYIKKAGNDKIILCERGIRTFENSTRFTLDISAVCVLKDKCDYPVVIDPSHASGNRDYVLALSRAAKAVGADGLIIEVHPNPDEALSDKNQQVTIEGFMDIIDSLKTIN